MARRHDEDEVYAGLDEKDILWAIHKNLIATEKSVHTIATILTIYFVLSLLGFVLLFLQASH